MELPTANSVSMAVGIYSYTFKNDTFKSVILESVKIKSLGVDAHCHCNIVEKTSDIVLPDNAPIFLFASDYTYSWKLAKVLE